jgi:hypothetical protein
LLHLLSFNECTLTCTCLCALLGFFFFAGQPFILSFPSNIPKSGLRSTTSWTTPSSSASSATVTKRRQAQRREPAGAPPLAAPPVLSRRHRWGLGTVGQWPTSGVICTSSSLSPPLDACGGAMGLRRRRLWPLSRPCPRPSPPCLPPPRPSSAESSAPSPAARYACPSKRSLQTITLAGVASFLAWPFLLRSPHRSSPQLSIGPCVYV